MRRTFADWCDAVEAFLWATHGIGRDDLPDWGWYDAYNAGVSPERAAKRAVRAAL